MSETIKAFCEFHWFKPSELESIKEILHEMGYTDLTFKTPMQEGIFPATLIGREEFEQFVESQTKNFTR